MSHGIASRLREKLATYALGTALLVVGVPVYLIGKHKLAEPAGAACEARTKCRGNGVLSTGMCLEVDAGAYCTHECAASADCAAGMVCEAVEGTWTTETTRGNHATQVRTSQGTRRVCVKGS